MKLVTIVGARPQFIKAASVSRAISKHNQKCSKSRIEEIVVHTGQHYDENMSRIFFHDLQIPEPAHNLGVGSGKHGQMTGVMLERVEDVLLQENPDMVLVYGDTNSTIAGALAAVKLHIPVAHVEAGLRSFNRDMPEEINRVLTDHVSSQLFCPTETAIENLKKEGITDGVINVGDVMFDTFLFYRKLAEEQSLILSKLRLVSKEYCLVTIHRQENTDSEERLSNIIEALNRLCSPTRSFIVPLHPRTRKIIEQSKGKHPRISPFIQMLEPVSYLDMILLETHSRAVLTDSGGVQKEAFFSEVPCITLRDETEWVELVENGYNVVVGNDPEDICRGFSMMVDKTIPINSNLYGDGQASERIVVAMEDL